MKKQLLTLLAILFATWCAQAQSVSTPVQFINPEEVAKPNGYSQAAVVDLGSSKMLIISGQVSHNAAGELVGKGNFEQQAEQVFVNLKHIIQSAGGSTDNIVKLSYFILDTKNLKSLRAIRDKYINVKTPPASTLVQVSSLFRDDILLEVEATAIIPVRK